MQKIEAAAREREDTQSKAALHSLEQEWGTKYAENMALAQRARTDFLKDVGGMTAEKERAVELLLGTPTWLKFLTKIGAGNRDPGFAGRGGAPGGFGNAQQAAQAEFDQLNADRVAGKISQGQWTALSAKGGKLEQLITTIAQGMAPMQ